MENGRWVDAPQRRVLASTPWDLLQDWRGVGFRRGAPILFLGLKMSLLVKKKNNNRTPPKIGEVKLSSPLQPKGLSGKLDVDDQAEATTQPTGVQWATKMPRNGFLGKKKRCHFDGGGGEEENHQGVAKMHRSNPKMRREGHGYQPQINPQTGGNGKNVNISAFLLFFFLVGRAKSW